MADAYLRGTDRAQRSLFPEALEDYIGPNHAVRVIDAFVDGLRTGEDDASLPPPREMTDAGGRKGYDPRSLAKLVIWGYFNRVRSTRDLERATYENIAAIWLLQKLHPDHTVIGRFRSSHAKRIKQWLRDFNRICASLELFGAEEVAVDGAILVAVNSKANNFTQQRLNRRLEKQEAEIQTYLEALEASEQEPEAIPEPGGEVENLAEKLGRLLTEQQHTQSMLEEAKASPTGQLSLVDPDARLIKKKSSPGTARVGFNAQSAVDSKHHLIAAVEVTQAGNDNGHLASMAEAARDNMQAPAAESEESCEQQDAPEPMRVLADAGYGDFDDIAATEEAGFEPHVALPQTSVAEKKGLFARSRFEYDEEADHYRCPSGEVLHRHADSKERGSIYQSYYNTKACRNCSLRAQCTRGQYRKIRHHPKQKAIDRMKERMKQDPQVYARRSPTVEHPFGSMLFWNGGRHLLCRGLEKANAEFSLSALAYNLKRALNVVGFEKLMEAVRHFWPDFRPNQLFAAALSVGRMPRGDPNHRIRRFCPQNRKRLGFV